MNTLLDKLPPLWERLKVTNPKLELPRDFASVWMEGGKASVKNGDDKFLWDFGEEKAVIYTSLSLSLSLSLSRLERLADTLLLSQIQVFKAPKSLKKKEKEEKKRDKKLKKLKKQHVIRSSSVDRALVMKRTQSARSTENLFANASKSTAVEIPDASDRRRSFTVQKVGGRKTVPFNLPNIPRAPRRHSTDSYISAPTTPSGTSSATTSSTTASRSRTTRVQSDLSLPQLRKKPHSAIAGFTYVPTPSPLSQSAPNHPFVAVHATPPSISNSVSPSAMSSPSSISASPPNIPTLPLSQSPSSSNQSSGPPSPTLLTSLLAAEPLHPLHQPLTPQPAHTSPASSQQSLMQQQVFAIFQQNIHQTKMLQAILESLPPRISTDKESDEPVG